MRSSPKLPLTPDERSSLRAFKIKLNDIAHLDVAELSVCLQCSHERARYLRALAEFQTIPSIGPKLAGWVIELGFYSLEDIKNENGADLINRLEQHFGYAEDPCVEDCLRCMVHHANHPDSDKSWFYFTSERKMFRQKYGYPATRPASTWQEKKPKTNGYDAHIHIKEM